MDRRRRRRRGGSSRAAGVKAAYLKEKYPDMKPVGARYGVAENVDDSRNTTL
jgi:simple sugar transport system substrate-binding protein